VSYSGEKKVRADELTITKKDPTLNKGFRIRLDSGHFSMQGVRNEMEGEFPSLRFPARSACVLVALSYVGCHPAQYASRA
jgi:hypothetical protein